MSNPNQDLGKETRSGRSSTGELTPKFSSVTSLQYPDNLHNDADQGHYVQFYINMQQAGAVDPQGGSGRTEITQPTPGGPAQPSGDEIASRAIGIKRAPTRRINTSISLYMPATVETSYGASYTDTEIGSMALAGVAAYDAYQSAGGNAVEGIKRGVDAAINVGLEGGALKVLGAMEAVGVSGAKAVVEMRSGKVINNRMEMIFESVARRSFNFTFKFLPKSQTESETVAEIVRQFKYHMHPDLEGNRSLSRTYVVPSTFDIEYIYKDKRNEYLNKIGTCVLEGMDVKYGGERYQTFEPNGRGAPPVEVEVSLNFKEMEILDKQRIADGY